MKTVIRVAICFCLSLGVLGLSGCGDEEVSYTNTPNDGHLHSYIHRLKDDAYICNLCGYEYPGDPSNLVEK